MALEEKIAELREVLDQIRAMQGVHMPSLSEAYSGDWQLVQDEALEGIGATAYLWETRTKDSQRVMPMKTAQSLLAEYEEALVSGLVLKGHQLVWKRYSRYYESLKWLFTHPDEVWAAVKEIVLADDLVELLIEYGIEIVALSEIKKTLAVAFKERDKMEARIRKRVLPHSTGPRHWRKTQATL